MVREMGEAGVEIEVTDQMIQAGAEALATTDGASQASQAEAAFLAMVVAGRMENTC